MNERKLLELCQYRFDQFKEFLNNLGVSTKNWSIKIGIGDIKEFPNRRNVAYTAYVSPTECYIVFAPKWKQLTDANYDAVIQHELCHVLHFLKPNIIRMLRDFGLFFDGDCYEIFADKMAEIIFDNPIYYDKHLVQTLKRGKYRNRPLSLGW